MVPVSEATEEIAVVVVEGGRERVEDIVKGGADVVENAELDVDILDKVNELMLPVVVLEKVT